MGIGLCLALNACAPTPPAVSRFLEPQVDSGGSDIPEGADPDACYGRDVTPAVIETVTEEIELTPAVLAPDGTVATPAQTRTERRPRIVTERREVWFETPCPPEMTEEFVASLQRALKVRGFYTGPVTGLADAATRDAVRRFQRTEGLNSGVLSIAAAKRLGLIIYDRKEALPAPD
ncbi:peptidoglycan-binding domain-containing protein [Mesobaculum littorinae]|uniref:peptidoglycan-binding domain-containing protein n=1 Tax=Mesobaculum littorinae TaxID=2486419 RepID=UPI001F417812|nr:peptidoglycan-binding domain-containing protein [Mesobaculum littorinae]